MNGDEDDEEAPFAALLDKFMHNKRPKIEEKKETPVVESTPLSEHAANSDVFVVNLGRPPPLDTLSLPLLSEPMDPSKETHMLEGGWVPAERIRELWRQKSRLDSVFDSGNQKVYYAVRSRLSKGSDDKGSSEFWNRAGDKLHEINQQVQFLVPEKCPDLVFLDVCGGPGAWSQFLFKSVPTARGFGMSLRSKEKSCNWYAVLEKDPRWKAVYGPTDTGDVYLVQNLDAVLMTAMDAARQQPSTSSTSSTPSTSSSPSTPAKITPPTAEVAIATTTTTKTEAITSTPAPLLNTDPQCLNLSLVVGDGGILIPNDASGKHMEHLQEVFSVRIILSEFLIAFRALAPGGSFVCKLFDCFADSTMSLIYLSRVLFDQVSVVKPTHSRGVNSERYVVCVGMTSDVAKRTQVTQVVAAAHKRAADTGALHVPLIDPDIMKGDPEFVAFARSMVTIIMDRQIAALAQVMDAVDIEMRNRPQHQNQGHRQNHGHHKHNHWKQNAQNKKREPPKQPQPQRQ